jgi:PAS domain S-box-containing protein
MSTQIPPQSPDLIEESPYLPETLSNLGILIVDDQADHSQLMSEILQSAGYQSVMIANGGREALDILDSQPNIALVLLDLVMPEMDGYEVCLRIKENPVTQDISVIVVTGGAIQVEAAITKSFDAGAIDFISKPLSRCDLLARTQCSLSLFFEKQQNLYQAGELLLREEKYRSLFESSIDAILVLNPEDLVIRDLNPSALTLLGFERDGMIGRAFTTLCPDSKIPEEYRKAAQLGDSEILRMETSLLSESGEPKSVEIKFSSYEFQGEVLIMAAVSDVSTRNQTLDQLALNEERLALAVTDKNNGIWDWDIGTGDIFFSENWRKFLGLNKDNLSKGYDVWKSYIHPDEVEHIIESMRSHWNGDSEYFMEEHRVRNKAGKYNWVLSRGRAVWNEAGEVVRMAGSMTDITEKKALEHQIIHMQKMEGLDRFSSGVALDLANMVMVVNSYSSLIKEAVPNHTAVSGYVSEIKQVTERSNSLVKQLLAFSRKNQIQLEYVFLHTELEDLIPMVKTVLGETIELKDDFAGELPPVMADHTMISQILLNLVINGRDAMPDGGTLTLGTALHQVEEAFLFDDLTIAPGEYIQMSVSDDGIGMDDELIEQIFEPFFTSKSTEDGQSGTGLGLSTVYGIMKQHRGWISVKSRPEIGTRFDLFFPVLNQESKAPVA